MFGGSLKLTNENFETTIVDNDFVIVDFWAQWCGPCKSFAPIYEKVSEDFPNVVFGKLDTEAHQAIAGHFQIRSIPTLMIFREKVMIFNQAGAMPEASLRSLLEKAAEIDMAEVHKEIAEQSAS